MLRLMDGGSLKRESVQRVLFLPLVALHGRDGQRRLATIIQSPCTAVLAGNSSPPAPIVDTDGLAGTHAHAAGLVQCHDRVGLVGGDPEQALMENRPSAPKTLSATISSAPPGKLMRSRRPSPALVT